MASPLEVFDAAVFEAVHQLLSVPDGDGAIGNLLAGFAEIVDGVTYPEVAEYLAPAIPRLVPEYPDGDVPEGEENGLIVNDFWYRDDTFGPVFYALARDFYERVRPVDYPVAPLAKLIENDEALFGCELGGIEFAGGADQAKVNAALLLWAGCAASAVKMHFHQPVTLALAYPLLFSFAQHYAA